MSLSSLRLSKASITRFSGMPNFSRTTAGISSLLILTLHLPVPVVSVSVRFLSASEADSAGQTEFTLRQQRVQGDKCEVLVQVVLHTHKNAGCLCKSVIVCTTVVHIGKLTHRIIPILCKYSSAGQDTVKW